MEFLCSHTGQLLWEVFYMDPQGKISADGLWALLCARVCNNSQQLSVYSPGEMLAAAPRWNPAKGSYTINFTAASPSPLPGALCFFNVCRIKKFFNKLIIPRSVLQGAWETLSTHAATYTLKEVENYTHTTMLLPRPQVQKQRFVSPAFCPEP